MAGSIIEDEEEYFEEPARVKRATIFGDEVEFDDSRAGGEFFQTVKDNSLETNREYERIDAFDMYLERASQKDKECFGCMIL